MLFLMVSILYIENFMWFCAKTIEMCQFLQFGKRGNKRANLTDSHRNSHDHKFCQQRAGTLADIFQKLSNSVEEIPKIYKFIENWR